MEQNCLYLQYNNDQNVISGAPIFLGTDFHKFCTSTLYIKSILLGATTWYIRKSDNWKEKDNNISDHNEIGRISNS